ncbi:porin [Pasteurellaceae bacterium 20609_3]|uniref:porin n=1 Tax=Spirabiliibacterium mucosae TaxID=28156 RepID=UPI001AAD3D58|nr:porin [Spirabiliibacterium mucosae]MBE2897475.1 porin [Spirabiliibacterium mucosae]
MKKTLVALAVAAMAATSANAAVVYNQDGTKVQVNGQFRMQLQRIGNSRTDLYDRGNRLEVMANQDLGNGFSAVGKYRLTFNGKDDKDSTGSTFGNPTTDQLYAGFEQKDIGRLYFGRLPTNGDAIMLGDYQLSSSGGSNPLTSSAKKGIHFKSADFSGFRVGADYIFGTPDKNAEGRVLKNGYGVAAYYDGKLAEATKLRVRAGLTHDRYENSDYKKAWRAAAELAQGPFALAYNYGEIRAKELGVTKDKETRHFIAAKYNITDMTSVFAQLKLEKREEKSKGYVVGVDHWLNKNFGTYIEFARDRNTKKVGSDYQNKYFTGFRYIF